jgi:hypothetical protein
MEMHGDAESSSFLPDVRIVLYQWTDDEYEKYIMLTFKTGLARLRYTRPYMTK